MAAILSLTGVFAIDMPEWLIKLAQIVVGTALGMRFTGLSRALVLRGVGLACVSVGGMLVVSAMFAVALPDCSVERTHWLVKGEHLCGYLIREKDSA